SLVVALTPGLSTSTSFSFTAPLSTEIYTLSLHDALPILKSMFTYPCSSLLPLTMSSESTRFSRMMETALFKVVPVSTTIGCFSRSEEHTSELQSRFDLVCRLLLEKKKKNIDNTLTNKQQR